MTKAINLDLLYLPHEEWALVELEEDIRQHGVREPILRNQDGVLLSGHVRLAIAEKLGIDVQEEFVETTGPLDDLVQTIRSNSKRTMAPKAQEDVVNELRQIWSDRLIAKWTGLSQTTIRRIPKSQISSPEPFGSGELSKPAATPRKTGADKKNYAPRATAEEVDDRRATAKQLWQEGWTMKSIAESLDVTPSTISKDLKTLGVDTSRRHKSQDSSPAAQQWRDTTSKESEPEIPSYKRSPYIQRIELWVKTFEGDRFPDAMKSLFRDAATAGDAKWVEEIIGLVTTMHEQTAQLAQVAAEVPRRRLRPVKTG